VRFSTKSSSANPQIEKQKKKTRAPGFSSNSSKFLTPNQASQTIAAHTKQKKNCEQDALKLLATREKIKSCSTVSG
jgi:hypothetical protein